MQRPPPLNKLCIIVIVIIAISVVIRIAVPRPIQTFGVRPRIRGLLRILVIFFVEMSERETALVGCYMEPFQLSFPTLLAQPECRL